ncbi:nicotinamide riboside kinase 1-like isoform X1 [Artemia franciscana]|uniref:Nicotinamide riboside kinase 1 n=1 Tax=Artemia franciscana TaxID=6661 RepID=A0AA88L0M7_ARTSF|nr:hypothetical protein QYM36_008921 [Artemia franciscana]KAK2714524.1 hypothetical protein QYM36_008921 [Artemia franciscana]
MKPVVVALGGVTNGGKSTIAKLLQDYFPLSKIMRQDDYFKLDNQDGMEYISELGHYNWDIMSAIDMNKFESEFNKNLTVLSELPSKSLLILEGFLVLNYKPLRPLMDLKYFFELEYEECWARRQTRNYDPPDVPGYFEKVVWPMYLKHRKELLDDCRDIHFISGSAPLSETFQKIIGDLEGLSLKSL